jgi:hypothetical protein
MARFYAARLEDLGSGDPVQLECACGHTMVAPTMLKSAANAMRGEAVVSIKWG